MIGPRQTVKGTIRAATGPPTPTPVTTTEQAILRRVLKASGQAANAGHALGKADKTAIDVALSDRATRLIGPLNRPRLLESVMKQIAKANTPGEVQAVTDRIVRAYVEGHPDVTMSEPQFNRYMEAVVNRNLRSGYKGGQLSITANQQEILEFAKATLPATEYKAIAKTLESILTSAVQQPAVRARLIERINHVVAAHEHASLVADARAAIAEAKATGVLLPSLQAKLEAVLDAVALRGVTQKQWDRASSIMDAWWREWEENVGKEHITVEPPTTEAKWAMRKFMDAGKPVIGSLSNDKLREFAVAIRRYIQTHIRLNTFEVGKQVRRADDVLKESLGNIEHAGGNRFSNRVRERTTVPIGVHPTALGGMAYGPLPAGMPTPVPVISKVGGGLGTREEASALGRVFHTINRSHMELAAAIGGEGTMTETVLFVEPMRAMRRAADVIWNGERALEAGAKAIGQTLDSMPAHMKEKVTVPMPGAMINGIRRITEQTITRGQLLDTVLSARRASFLDDVTRNKQQGIRYDGTVEIIKPSAETMKAILDSDEAQALLPFIQAVEPFIQETGLALNEVVRKDTGLPLKLEEHYHPTTRDMQEQKVEPSVAMRNFRENHLEDAGFLKSKSQANLAYRMTDGFGRLRKYVKEAAAVIHVGPAVRNARRLMGDPSWRKGVRYNVPRAEEVLRDLKEAIDEFEGTHYKEPKDIVDRMLGGVIRGAHRAELGLSLVPLYQPLSYYWAAVEVPMAHLNSALLAVARHPSLNGIAERWLNEHSPLARARFHGSWHGLATPGAAGGTGKASKALDTVSMGLISAADRKTINQLALAVMDEAGIDLSELVNSTDAADAIAEKLVDRHDYVTMQSQPTGDMLSITNLQRWAAKNPLKKATLSMFTSAAFKGASAMQRIIRRYVQAARGRSPRPQDIMPDTPARPRDASLAETLAKLAMIGIATPAAVYAISKYGNKSVNRAFRWIGETAGLLEKAKRVPPKDSAGKAVAGIAQRVLGQWGLWGQAGATIIRAVSQSKYGTGASQAGGAYGVDIPVKLTIALTDLYAAVAKAVEDDGPKIDATGKRGKAIVRAIEDVATAVAPVFGLPIRGPLRMASPVLFPPQKQSLAARHLLWTLFDDPPRRREVPSADRSVKQIESDADYGKKYQKWVADKQEARELLRTFDLTDDELRAAFQEAGKQFLSSTLLATKEAAEARADGKVKEGDPYSNVFYKKQAKFDAWLPTRTKKAE